MFMYFHINADSKHEIQPSVCVCELECECVINSMCKEATGPHLVKYLIWCNDAVQLLRSVISMACWMNNNGFSDSKIVVGQQLRIVNFVKRRMCMSIRFCYICFSKSPETPGHSGDYAHSIIKPQIFPNIFTTQWLWFWCSRTYSTHFVCVQHLNVSSDQIQVNTFQYGNYMDFVIWKSFSSSTGDMFIIFE